MEPKVKLLISLFVLISASGTISAQNTAWAKLTDAGGSAFRQGQLQEAEKNYVNALKEAEKFGEQDWRFSASLINLAGIYQAEGRYKEAQLPYQRALEITQRVKGPEGEGVGTICNELGKVFIALGKYKEAEPLIKQALAIFEKEGGSENLSVAGSLATLGWLYLKQQKYSEAEPFYKRSLTIFEKSLGPEHPAVAVILDQYSEALRKMKRKAEASEMEKRAKKIRAKNGSDATYPTTLQSRR
jgi:tetratricopeptide (TPR) repeat protein